jgi:hypothetical protein
LEDDQQALVDLLERMHEEASETEERCTALTGEFEGKKTAILEQARETKQSATEMMQTFEAAVLELLSDASRTGRKAA